MQGSLWFLYFKFQSALSNDLLLYISHIIHARNATNALWCEHNIEENWEAFLVWSPGIPWGSRCGYQGYSGLWQGERYFADGADPLWICRGSLPQSRLTVRWQHVQTGGQKREWLHLVQGILGFLRDLCQGWVVFTLPQFRRVHEFLWQQGQRKTRQNWCLKCMTWTTQELWAERNSKPCSRELREWLKISVCWFRALS